jgi:hypothetical protein
MLPVFTYPVALWGLLALPALAAIYLLRQRFRRRPISSLLLWLDPAESPEGGPRLDRLRTPLLFFLELAALALLSIAAADPQVRLTQGARPLVVVLDDSFSMQAGAPDTPRARAAAALADELRQAPRHSVRFVLAGSTPQLLGEPARTPGEALDLLDGWRCRAPTARLEAALGLAAEIGGELALLLVLTDHPPPENLPTLGQGKIQWWSFGRPRPNLAFVNAARTTSANSESCLLEVANLADVPQSATLLVETGTPPVERRRDDLQLEPRQTHRLILPLGEDAPALHARLLIDDALPIDNEVSLLPVSARPVRVEVRLSDDDLRRPVEKALRSTRRALLTDTRPDVIFSDDPETAEGDAWRVLVLAEKNALAYTGPFVLDRTHPLTDGLSLEGVVWAAGKAGAFPGDPVILAGNVPLLTDSPGPGRRHDVRLRLRPDLSTLPRSLAWPVLIDNLLAWHASLAPGLDRPNLRLGEEAVLTLAEPPPGPLALTRPDGTTQSLPAEDERVTVRADEPGLYSLQAPDGPVRLAANVLSRDESDLTGCAAGRWGDWRDETSLRLEYRSLSWLALLLVLTVLTVHLALMARGRGK